MNNGQAFRRAYRLTIGDLSITELDIEFTITRSLKKEPNTADIRIRNLHPDNRRRIEQARSVRVVLEAGYAPPLGTSMIFAGDLREIYTERDGADWVTHVATGDAEQTSKKARIHITFQPGTAVRKVIEETAKKLIGSYGNLKSIANIEVPNLGEKFNTGTVVSGNAAKELDRLLLSAGLEYSVQNGVLQVVKRGEGLDGTAILLTPATGLVGSPSVSSDGTVRFRCLMIPDLFPGRKVQLDAINAKGVFIVDACKYVGDTASNDWIVDCEAKLPGQFNKALREKKK